MAYQGLERQGIGSQGMGGGWCAPVAAPWKVAKLRRSPEAKEQENARAHTHTQARNKENDPSH